MNSVLIAFFAVLASSFRTSASLRAEILPLRHQLAVLHGSDSRPYIGHGAEPRRWGSGVINGEPLKLGTEIAKPTVGKCLPHRRKPPSQTWRAFLSNHLAEMASMDFFPVPTATFRVLFVLVVLSHARRRIVHFAVTEHPTQEWTLQQLREAFPWNQSPQYLLRDRDAIYGEHLVAVIEGMGIEEVLTAPRSPW